MEPEYVEALSAKVLVTVTFPYWKEKLPFLFQVIKTLSGLPIPVLDIIVVTNSSSEEEIDTINQLCRQVVRVEPQSSVFWQSLEVRSYPDIPNIWHLYWMHKKIICEQFVNGNVKYTHYINMEYDVEISFQSFCYFLKYRRALERWRVVPSFLRVEYNFLDNQFYCADQVELTNLQSRSAIMFDGMWFVNMSNPRIGMFMLDQALAREHVASRSFDLEKSEQVQTWWIPERASMGLCFEGLPEGFSSRYVVPVNPVELTVPSFAYLYRVGNAFANDAWNRFGKIRMTQLFLRGIPEIRNIPQFFDGNPFSDRCSMGDTSLTETLLTASSWYYFQEGQLSFVAEVRFLLNRRIVGSGDHSQHLWRIENGILSLYGSDGQCILRFDDVRVVAERLELRARMQSPSAGTKISVLMQSTSAM
jgi:hypothetical protein